MQNQQRIVVGRLANFVSPILGSHHTELLTIELVVAPF